MKFQNPLILAGLAVVALPVVLNLLGRAAARQRSWGAMMFLDSTASAARRVPSRQTLLMLTRAGLLAALVLAFGRPLRSNDSAAGVQRVIVVDTGPSMGLFDGGIRRLDRAKAAALKSIATLQPDDRAALVSSAITVRPTGDLQSLAARINDLTVSRNSIDPSASLQTAVALTADPARREQICLIGDLTDASWTRALSTSSVPVRQKLFACDLGNDGANDLLLRDLLIFDTATGQVSASVKVVNTAAAVQEIRLRWAIDAVDNDVSNVRVPARGSTTAFLTPFTRPAGPHLVTAALADAIPSTVPDLSATFSIEPRQKVLVAGDDAAVVAAAMTGPDIRFVHDLSAADLSACNLLVLCGGPFPAGDLLNSVARFVRVGGRLLVLPGEEFENPKIEASLDRMLLLPARGLSSARANLFPLRLATGGQKLPGSWILRWVKSARGAHELIPFVGASPLAVSVAVGRGEVMLASTGLSDADPSLADSPLLRPWTSALVDELSPPLEVMPALVEGETFIASVPAPVDLHSAVVQTPEGQTDGIVVRRSADVCELRYPQTKVAGLYRMTYRSNGRPHQTFFTVAPPSPPVVGKTTFQPPALIGVRTSDQLAMALSADRPRPLDGFWPLMAGAIALFVNGIVIESTCSQGRS